RLLLLRDRVRPIRVWRRGRGFFCLAVASWKLDRRLFVNSVNVAQSRADFSERRISADGLNRRGHSVVAVLGGFLYIIERACDSAFVTRGAHAFESLDLAVTHGLINDESRNRSRFFFHLILVNADDCLLARFERLLILIGRFLNL